MIVINSRLSVEECLRRLRRKADPPWAVFGQKRLIGGVLGKWFFAHKRPELFQRNSTGPVLSARVEPGPEGAVIYCSFRPQVFMILVAIWVVFAARIVISAGISGVRKVISGDLSINSWLECLIPIAFLAFAAFFIFLYRNQSAADRSFLLNAVRRAVDEAASLAVDE